MEGLSQNPFWVTLFGMSVVMATLAVLMFLCKILSWLIQMGEARSQEKSENVPTTPQRQPPPESEILLPVTPHPEADSPDEGELVAILTAAASTVLEGSTIRLVSFSARNPAPHENGWVQAGRLQNMTLPRRS